MPQLLYIFLTGTFSYFRSVEQSLQSEFDSQLPPASMPSILLRILQAQIAQADEEHDKAIAIQASVSQNVLHQPVITGMIALSAALSGKSEMADNAIADKLPTVMRKAYIAAMLANGG